MNQNPTDALRLVPVEPTEAMVANALGTLTVPGPVEQTKAMIRQFYRAMLSAAPASPLPGGGDILWMMHVRGPDDIYPAPDYETAVAWCDYVNDVLAKAVPEVMTKAVPAIWTLSPQEHAAYLPEAIKGWTLPAAPTGDAK